jgi:nanoRNase/pAp phosphatase (c-di-AMP/oligoRNAs hydrolase)
MQSQAVEATTAVGEELLGFARQEPALVAVAVVAGLLAVVGGVALYRYLRRTAGDRFVSALADEDRVAVLMHPDPDPDAMASALAVSALADAVDTDTEMVYSGQIRHAENRAFETVLDCDFDRIERRADIDAGPVVLVDHNVPRGFDGADGVTPFAVVDHHPGNGEGEAVTDVRPERGSCASILTDYLHDPEAEGHSVQPSLATGLLYGIQSDTTAFTRGCTPGEFDAAAYLFPAADPDSLERIANPEIDSETLDIKARAITGRTVEGSFLVSHVGSLSNQDALPMAADELVRMEGVTAAVVTGETDGTIQLSGRSRDDRVHMGKTMEVALEALSDAGGGGHARMGGGQVTPPESAANRETQLEIQERLFAAMNGEV